MIEDASWVDINECESFACATTNILNAQLRFKNTTQVETKVSLSLLFHKKLNECKWLTLSFPKTKFKINKLYTLLGKSFCQYNEIVCPT